LRPKSEGQKTQTERGAGKGGHAKGQGPNRTLAGEVGEAHRPEESSLGQGDGASSAVGGKNRTWSVKRRKAEDDKQERREVGTGPNRERPSKPKGISLRGEAHTLSPR